MANTQTKQECCLLSFFGCMCEGGETDVNVNLISLSALYSSLLSCFFSSALNDLALKVFDSNKCQLK